MNIIEVIIRCILSYIFISSAITKLFNYDEHVRIVKNYKLTPRKFIQFIGFILTVLILSEIFTGALFLINQWANLASFMCLGLLILYTLAIIANLLRNRVDISCGCGGILGNHNISWSLVVRNFVLVILAVLLISGSLKITNISLLSLDIYVSTIILTYISMFIYNCCLNILAINKKVKMLKETTQ
ncbi:DoxX family membrane protein [Cohnella pontilimi]|uniref:DoxX family membrane protein n=1 Tax=Cohnella pontilimi TaxID=2564100 RepID=A0A4U0FCY2_9BACL|nr:DoxX family membrane protein [Cohnella pontilimi]